MYIINTIKYLHNQSILIWYNYVGVEMDGCLCPHSLIHPIHLTNTHEGNIIPLCKSPTIYHQCSLATREFEVYNSTLQLVTLRLASHASC